MKRYVFFLALLACTIVRVHAVGFTPTDGGLVVDLKSGDRILLSVWVDKNGNGTEEEGEEFFVCHYPGYTTGSYFNYTNWDGGKGNFLKLVPQDPTATEPSSASVWTIDEAVPLLYSNTPYTLDGIAYTMWSSNDPSYTLLTSSGNSYKYQGDLTRETNNKNICNAIFVAPTNRESVTSFDPNNTMGRGTKFNGEKGFGFLGLPYREVYWLDIPRSNSNPASYTNASIVCFNTTLSNYKYSSNAETAKPGQALYAFADNKHKPTKRTIFRLYMLDEPYTASCPDSYFFAFDKQDYVQYREFDKNTDTSKRKIYTIDHLVCMERLAETKYHQTDLMNVPTDDSTYYYVGYDNNYCHTDRGDDFNSQFKKISTLPIHGLPGKIAPEGALGRMIVDTTATATQNLGVAFKPEGFFLRTSSGRNIRMKQTGEYEWTCEEMWHITAEYAALYIKATMFSGTEYSETDEGVDIADWSTMVQGTSVPVVGGGDIVGMDGWARIHTNSSDPNGHMEFVPANGTRHIHYDNNGLVGTQIPDQYPEYGQTTVTVENERLVGGFDFLGWTTNADGTGTTYQPGDIIDLPAGELTLYAQATYTGSYHVAFSFVQDGQRYYLTHPGLGVERISHARRTTDWTDTYQGMENAENRNPNYINTFKLITGPDPCAECVGGEAVLDPRREMRYGAVDSLLFYENFSPADEEYIGLYFDTPNAIIANDTWAGLFTSTGGWPNYSNATVQNTKLKSTHYLARDGGGNIVRIQRPNSAESWVKYNPATDMFEGEASEANATLFQISRVRVADEHYVVIPDTTEEWTNEITFGYHESETSERVWSKLIGKQLMAMTSVGNDVVYFHPNPNPDKIITEATQMRLNANYRLEETFEYIHDVRAAGTVDDEDKPHINDRLDKNYFGRLITSGMHSPMDLMYQGNYIDMVDTLRITLRPTGTGKIKDYYGRWKTGAEGLHVRPDGSRYRDILVTTKTYHYGATQTRLVLRPEYNDYLFNPFAGTARTINFTLEKQTVRQLLDAEGNPIGEVEIIDTEDITPRLALSPGACSFTHGSAYFAVNSEQTVSQHATIYTREENTSEGENEDTLLVSTSVTIDAVSYPVTGRVPLMQTTTYFDELLWSAVVGGQRYFIMANGSGLLFHEYTEKNSMLYKKNTSTQLIVGAASTATDEYITPWTFEYVTGHPDQLTLSTEYGVNKNFVIDGSTPVASTASPAVLSYRYVDIYRNENGNEEELVRLKYGPDQWLKLQVTAGEPSLVLWGDSASATVFSWGYMDREYYLTNNGSYPDKEYLEFFYNRTSPATIQSRYKAYRLYSMLLGNKLTYLCREEETNLTNLTDPDGDWLTNFNVTCVRDARSFDGGAKSSGLTVTTDNTTLTTTVTPEGASPLDVTIGGKYVTIVDTLDVQISLRNNAPEYRFSGNWSSYGSVEDAHLKIPLIRRTYHQAAYDSIVCLVEGEEYNYAFPARIETDVNDEHTFVLSTEQHTGRHVLSVDNEPVAVLDPKTEEVSGMDLTNVAQVLFVDDRGNRPSWCRIEEITANTITVKALESGIRSPRYATVYLAYVVEVADVQRIVTFRFTVSQASLFQYANNQHLVHTKGASGDELMANGMQQVHENKRVLYYYNPTNINQSPDQNVELPVRERAFYGWWRWYREGEDINGVDVGDTDIPDSLWVNPPRNVGKYNFPYRIIGDSVWKDEADHSKGKELVTMGRYTVFHYRSKDYSNKNDPPAKNPLIAPPTNKAVVTYAVDISNYYDNLPLSMKSVNNVDTAKLDTMTAINEPTLSLREVFELHPWTEMAARMESYKSPVGATYPLADEHYLEDHVMMAPTGNRLLLNTEQRYRYENLVANGHSESLLGYYMRDDNWSSMSAVPDPVTGITRQDTMIWCGGWDADCEWFTYDKEFEHYSPCTHPVMTETDFLQVPARANITTGQDADTVYYCLRARSKATTGTPGENEETDDEGAYWFNICRYTIIYHKPGKYGPMKETKVGDVTKALITNDEIEQKYEVLERLDFDYNKPGSDYTLYPHPLPWADASYGYTYPIKALLPVNRYHDETDFPNHGEYGIINKIPYSTYWRKMEQHGGAANGYMIYCDGMASAGQVAALTLNTHLCAGQKMFFSGYFGNPSSQTGKADPNFIISVQGSEDGTVWDDITSYMTGDIKPSDNWYQVYFPITHTSERKTYVHFRVRIYNVAANFDGNDFVIDDMCIFATKPPLIAYQANTACKETGEEETPTNVILRVDYQGITGEGYNDADVYYTIKCVDAENHVRFVDMIDGYLNPGEHKGAGSQPDTIFGRLYIPSKDYEPTDVDSIFVNMNDLVDTFHVSDGAFKEGYIYEILEGDIRPVKYVIHSAYMNPADTFTVHMSSDYDELLSSICGMTSHLNVSNQMVLALNGEEQPDTEQFGLCANATYDIGLRVKGSLYRDSIAPLELNGTCYNDWLLHGDTAEATSVLTYGYKYADIVAVIKDILRCAPKGTTNANQFASNLAAVSRNEMQRIKDAENVTLETSDHPYDVLAHLVNNGFLTLYQPTVTATVYTGDSVQYVIFPILGTGTDAMHDNTNVEVCPLPIFIKLKPDAGTGAPLILGGLNRDPSEMNQPVVVLSDVTMANSEIQIKVDSIMPMVGIYSIELRSTDDPNFREGIHSLAFEPDMPYPAVSYYTKGDMLTLTPATTNNYEMQPGYNYEFDIVMQTITGSLTIDPLDPNSCRVGTVPFTLSVVPSYMRWAPQDAESNQWNTPGNWIGVDEHNHPLPVPTRFAPLSSTAVIIPAMTDGMPYPQLPDLDEPLTYDSIKQVGFTYNTCDKIRFLPGAAIGHQQRLTSTQAIIDMSMPHATWAFRAAPIKGMISGDIFMANADLHHESSLWEVSEFDASGRNYQTGNASFWLSLYSKTVVHYGNGDNIKNDTTSSAEWSKVTNGITLPLPPAQGWAVYTRTPSGDGTDVRLPKNDDIYYYYYASGEKAYDHYEQNLRDLRETNAVAQGGHAGELAFMPDGSSQVYHLVKETGSSSFVFGNPSMGYIDIWGFIRDNDLYEQISYMSPSGSYTTVPKATADATEDVITELTRYLPPMHAMVISVKAGTPSELDVTLNTSRVLTAVSVPLAPAPRRMPDKVLPKGIMTVTAINPVSSRCTSRLLLGQGYNDAILAGEDAILSTININNYSNTSAPATPFNIYAAEDGYGLSVDLRDSIVNVPISFYMSELPYDPVTYLWFTGVNNIDGQLVLYDALTDTEQPIKDGICIYIETPEMSHQTRYFIRNHGVKQSMDTTEDIVEVEPAREHGEQAMKILYNGHVLIVRDGHVYTMYGQKLR